jgi:phospholipase D1/2
MGRVLYLQKEGRPRRDAAAPETDTLFRPGYNVSAIARAERVALLVDAEAYFKAFQAAALRAQHSIMVLAWDFNSRTRLHFDPVAKDGPPALLGDFLNFLVRRRRGLHINILNWDYPMVFGADREFPPIYGFGWTPARHVHLRYDDTHPVAGCQHQKIVAIDDRVAFVGGIDLTVRRWDTSSHRADEPRRVAYDKPYPPFHDLMVALDGDAARELAGIARERWKAATGTSLKPVAGGSSGDDPWPQHLRPQMHDVEVGIARTMPPRGEVPAVREIEKLYLDTIAAARQTLYIENQYFTAPRIAAALEKRLQERDGPEIVLVLRLLSHGWLEEHTMQVLRTRLVQRLIAADRYGRFHVYYPHVPGLAEGCCLDVHSKLMIADDRMVRIGSANICNRSMALDSECDVAIESRGRPEVAQVITGLRDDLLAEHLGARPEAVREAVTRAGSLHGAISSLAGGSGRTMQPFEDLKEWPDAIVELAAVADPEEPIAPSILDLERRSEDEEPGPAKASWLKLGLIAAVFLCLAALWRLTPLANAVSAETVIAWAHDFGARWWAPLVIIAAYTPACFVMFPRPLITLAGVVAFGAWLGFVYALIGIVASAAVTYFVGQRMRRDTVRRMAGPKLDRIVAVLRKHGLLAMALLRLVPLAPFAIEGMVAGAVRLKLWHLLAGTAIGMLPGTLAATLFGDQLERAATGGGVNWWIVGTAAVLLTGGAIAVKRWFSRMSSRIANQPT